MTTEPMRQGSVSPEISGALLDQTFRLWVEPAISEQGMNLTRQDVSKALVVFAPSTNPRVYVNDDAQLIAQVRASRDIKAGQEVTLECRGTPAGVFSGAKTLASPSNQAGTPLRQAENAGSIPVARSKDFGAEPNDDKGFRLTSRVHRVPTMSRVTRPLALTKRPKYLQTGCRH